MEPLIFLTLAVAGVGILVAFLLFDLKSNVNKLQVYVQEFSNGQEEKYKELQTLLSQFEKNLGEKVNKLQVYVEDLEKINQENLNKQEEKFKELQTLLSQLAKNNLENLIKYLGEYASPTIQQLETTQKELEELKDSINKMYKLLTEEITDKDL